MYLFVKTIFNHPSQPHLSSSLTDPNLSKLCPNLFMQFCTFTNILQTCQTIIHCTMHALAGSQRGLFLKQQLKRFTITVAGLLRACGGHVRNYYEAQSVPFILLFSTVRFQVLSVTLHYAGLRLWWTCA